MLGLRARGSVRVCSTSTKLILNIFAGFDVVAEHHVSGSGGGGHQRSLSGVPRFGCASVASVSAVSECVEQLESQWQLDVSRTANKNRAPLR